MKDWIISFVVIARNAASTLPRLLESLDAQTWPHDRMEILLVDGFSEDGTRKVMEAYAARNDFLRTLVLDNPGRNLPSGWNVALARAAGEAVLRVDAHAFFPPDFVARSAAAQRSGGIEAQASSRPEPTSSTRMPAARRISGSAS